MIKDSFEREAARVNLRKMLETKKRGDRITAADVVESTGFADWSSFGHTIRSWARKAGFVLVPVRNDGWQIGLAVSHIDYSEKQRRSEKRKAHERLRALVSAPQTELEPSQIRRHEFLLVRAASAAQIADQHDREIRKELKLTERIPLQLPRKTAATG